MEDLTGRLSELLNSPEGLEQIKNVAGMLGLSGGLPGAAEPAAIPSAAPTPVSNDMMSSFMKFAPLLGRLQGDDETTRFLAALRPMLGEERQKKLDEAVKILRLIRLLPLLKDTGIFSSLF